MGRDSGLAVGLILLLALALSKPRKLTSASFGNGRAITYRQYYEYATASGEDVEADDSSELTESETTLGQVGVWRTINGRIPTPHGTTIPLPTVHVGRTPVETMLQPLEEAKEEPHFQDVAGRRSVNLRLRPIS